MDLHKRQVLIICSAYGLLRILYPKKNDLKRPTVFVNLSGDINWVIFFSFSLVKKNLPRNLSTTFFSIFIPFAKKGEPCDSPECYANLAAISFSASVAKFLSQLSKCFFIKASNTGGISASANRVKYPTPVFGAPTSSSSQKCVSPLS